MKKLLNTLSKIRPQDSAARARARQRLESLAMPKWALGRLMDLAVDLAGMTGREDMKFSRRTVVVMAGDHGVADEGVSGYPSEVTLQMINTFLRGKAGVNALAEQAGARVFVVDMGVKKVPKGFDPDGKILDKRIGPGTSNIRKGPAMTRREAQASVEAGIEVAHRLSGKTDMFATGDMGIGNTTASSAIVSVLCDAPVSVVTGKGTGIDEESFDNKIRVIEDAIRINAPDGRDALDVLSKVGGFEIGGIAGLILGAASLGRPVMVDGFISTAGALIAQALCPVSTDYMIAAHRSVEQGHSVALERLGLEPLLDLGMRLGEGSGAALAFNILDGAVNVYKRVATFEEAGVSGVTEK